MPDNLDLFSLLMAAAGLYLFFSGVRGKGKLFENEYPKPSREVYVKWMRLACLLAGLLVVTHAALKLFSLLDTMWDNILTWVVLASVVGVVVLNVVMTDRKAMEEARRREDEERRKAENHPLRAAFFFDEEDDNLDGDGEGDSQDADSE